MIYGIIMYTVHPWTSRKSNVTLSGKNDLLGALEVKLDHSNLIRNISPIV